jgi:hypothetical protein
MATIIKIGHASISENNTAYGQAGDTTGKEVCINHTFNILDLAPTVVLRPKSLVLAEASAIACEAGCANNNIGYSQSGRNTLYTYAGTVNYDLSKVTTQCNTDCSAFMTVCAIAGGANISYGSNAPTTTNMRTRFKQSGDYIILTDTKHRTLTDYLKRGDILVCEGSHTVMVLENGSKYVNDESDPGATSGITPISNIHTYALPVALSDVKATSTVITFKVIEQLNGIEKVLANPKKWTFNVTVQTTSGVSVIERTLTSATSTLSGLKAGHSYIVQVNAIGTDGAITFCSAPRIVTTVQKAEPSDNFEDLGDKALSKHLKLVNKIYVNIQNSFKQALIYKNK